MPRNEKRPPLVRSLRALARKLGVEDVAGDEVGRAASRSAKDDFDTGFEDAVDTQEANTESWQGHGLRQ